MSSPAPAGDSLLALVRTAGAAGGLDAVGVTGVEPFDEVRRSLEKRRDAGHHAGMSFTFRNPRRSTEPARLLRNAASIVVGIRSYLEPAPEPASEASASVARYAWRDHYADLEAGLEAIAVVLRAQGHRAVVVADQNALVDRAAAHRAGLGWWGRNSNLLTPGLGSWFVIGSVVTDAELPVADAPMADGCRTCTRCVTACPTAAIVDDGVIDARRCLAWLVQAAGVFPRAHRVALGDRLYGCDDCQDACPPGRRGVSDLAPDAADDANPLENQPADGPALDAQVPVLQLLATTDDDLLAAYGRWYIPRRQPRYLRRNALIVLGNIGRADDPDHVACLARWITDEDPLLRAHAVWAAARLGCVDLVARAARDEDPLVRAEVALAPAVPPAPGAAQTQRVEVR